MSADALKPRRTHRSTKVWRLPGGTEDNDLWVEERVAEGDVPVQASTFVPTEKQRSRIAAGENIEVLIWGSGQPPIAVVLSDIPIGKPPERV